MEAIMIWDIDKIYQWHFDNILLTKSNNRRNYEVQEIPNSVHLQKKYTIPQNCENCFETLHPHFAKI